MPEDNWVLRPKPNPNAKLRLFCFPYAGGGASVFYTWPKDLPGTVEVCPIQLPGREGRLMEPVFTRLAPMVQALISAMSRYLDRPFAFFGHSMGALIGFETAKRLRAMNGPDPVQLFISASRAPHLEEQAPTHDLPEEDLIVRLRSLNGTAQVVLDNPEWLRLYLPIVRADLAVDETYWSPDRVPVKCPILAFGGSSDKEVTLEELEAWRLATSGRFLLKILPGDHFFLRSAQPLLLRMIAQSLGYVF
jgi:medium-chain acyl-[acyl-carrier-protein] hydrolase